jgi:hypothetical protein
VERGDFEKKVAAELPVGVVVIFSYGERLRQVHFAQQDNANFQFSESGARSGRFRIGIEPNRNI